MPLSNPGLFKQVQNYEPVYGGIQFGGEENATTLRPSSTALFCISSADRYDTQEAARNNTKSPYRFTITKKESLLNGFFTRMALTELRLPWTLPNIAREVYTNAIGISCGTDSHVIDILNNYPDPVTGGNVTLDALFFSPAELAARIQSAWNTAYPANQIVMEVDDDMSFRLYSAVDGGTAAAAKTCSVYPLTPSTTPSLPVNTYQLFDMMNWVNGDSVPTTGYTISGIGDNLLWTDYVDIVSNDLTYNQALKDSSSSKTYRDIIYRVYLTNGESPYNYPNVAVTNNTTSDVDPSVQYVGLLSQGSRPFLIYRQFQNPKEIRWNKQQPIGQVSFELYDDKGRALADLFPAPGGTGRTAYANGQGSDWNMTMLVSEN